MPQLEIPEGYWTITPAGFQGRAQEFGAQLAELRGALLSSAGAVLGGNNSDLVADLALSDANEPTIRAAMGVEYNVTRDQSTGAVLALYPVGDDLATTASQSTPPDQSVAQGTFPYPSTPGDPPTGDGPDTPYIESLSERVSSLEQRVNASGVPAPPAPPAPPPGKVGPPAPPEPDTGLPTYDQVNNAYWQDMGRGAAYQEYVDFWQGRPDWREAIYNSDEAQAYRARQREDAKPDPSTFVSPADLAASLAALDATIHIVV